MKGISTIIATLLMLVITIGLAGMAYMYIIGTATTQVQGIDLVDIYCVGSSVTIRVRNIGTLPTNVTCTQTSPPGDNNCDTATSSTINPNEIGTLTDSCSDSGTGARICSYRLTPLAGGRTISASVHCG
ncbi:MAG: hypothetical protein QXL86_02000 [Candidatus Aenigmatarchaeota archaeon]